MLDLSRAYADAPRNVLCSLVLQDRSVLVAHINTIAFSSSNTLQVYPSGDTLVVLNARSLALERILCLWEVFPSTRDSGRCIADVVIDEGLKVVRVLQSTTLKYMNSVPEFRSLHSRDLCSHFGILQESMKLSGEFTRP